MAEQRGAEDSRRRRLGCKASSLSRARGTPLGSLAVLAEGPQGLQGGAAWEISVDSACREGLGLGPLSPCRN